MTGRVAAGAHASTTTWISSGSVLVAVVGVAWFVATTGPMVNVRFGHDVPIVLDGAWRVLHGQVPTVDFHTLFGPLFFVLVALGMWVGGASMNALVALTVIMFAGLTTWAWWLSLRRTSLVIAVAFTVLVGLLVVGTYHLGFDSAVSTYANLYNRYGYALLFLLLFELFFPPQNLGGRADALGGFSSGIILVALFFMKFTFFAAAIGFLVVAVVAVRRTRAWGQGLCAGVTALLLPMAIYMRFQFPRLIEEYLLPVQVRGPVVTGAEYISSKVMPSLARMGVVAAMAVVVASAPAGRRTKIRVATLLAAGFVAAVALNITNYGTTDMPLLAFLVLVPVELFRRDSATMGPRRVATWLVLGGLALVAAGPFLFKNLASVPTARRIKGKVGPALPRVEAPPLADFLVIDADGMGNEDYVGKLNEALALLRAHTGPGDRVASLNFENPFSFALLRAPPSGDVSSWHLGYSFDATHAWAAEEVFANVTILMVPRDRDDEAVTPLLRIYGTWLALNFDVVEVSPRWALARRR